LRLRPHIAGAAAALGHELVEFRFILGVPQPVEKFLEFALLFFEAAQSFGAVFVKRSVAARGAIAASTPALRGCLHPLDAALHALDPTLPTIRAPMSPACHSSTPYQKSEKHKAERPKQSMMMHD